MLEHESHSHAHHTGTRWLDLILAGSAILISVVSLVVSVHHGRTMEKLVAANEKQVEASTLPILRFSTGNELEHVKTIHLDLSNGGTGPAIIEWFRINWNGRATEGPQDLLSHCCGTPEHAVPYWQNLASGSTLPAGQAESILQVRAADAPPALYNSLDGEARFKLEAEACYCSVLDQCWITDFKDRPRSVKACEAVPRSQHW